MSLLVVFINQSDGRNFKLISRKDGEEDLLKLKTSIRKWIEVTK